MKIIAGLFIGLLSFSVSARPTEVECSGRSISVTVEEAFSPGSLRQAHAVTATESGDFTVIARGWFANRIRYQSTGFDLDVDFWPDSKPRWGRFYRGIFRSPDLNVPNTQMSCRFPNISP